MSEIVLSTVLSFDNTEEIIEDCIECVRDNELMDENGVPEDWEDEDAWDEDAIHDFLSIHGTVFYLYQNGDFEDIFNDDVNETRVEITF